MKKSGVINGAEKIHRGSSILVVDIQEKISAAEHKFNESRDQSEKAKDMSLVALYTSRAMNHATFARDLQKIMFTIEGIRNIANDIIEAHNKETAPFNPVEAFKSGIDSTYEKKNSD